MITYFTRRSRRYSPINSRDPMCSLPFSSPTMGKFLWTLFIHPIPIALVVTRYLETFFDVSKILCSLLPWRFFLPADIMVDSICLSILHRRPLSLPYRSYENHHVCECTQSSI